MANSLRVIIQHCTIFYFQACPVPPQQSEAVLRGSSYQETPVGGRGRALTDRHEHRILPWRLRVQVPRCCAQPSRSRVDQGILLLSICFLFFSLLQPLYQVCCTVASSTLCSQSMLGRLFGLTTSSSPFAVSNSDCSRGRTGVGLSAPTRRSGRRERCGPMDRSAHRLACWGPRGADARMALWRPREAPPRRAAGPLPLSPP